MRQHQRVWIAWEDETSIRSKVLAKEMGVKFYAFTLFENIPPLRYITAVFLTLLALIREQPRSLIVQNPSIVLCFVAALVKPFFGYALIVDLHTPYLHPQGFRKVIMTFLDRFALKRSNIIIVTNDSYKNRLQEQIEGDKILVLPDKFPEFEHEFKGTTLQGKNSVLFICTFSVDEPWQEVINAARLVDEETYVYVSGRHSLSQADMPPNLVLTGYLSDEDYQNLIRSVNIIMVLTTEEDCMVCGAYEAVSAEKPLILSDKRVLREYFNQGVIFTCNNSDAIAAAINQAIQGQTTLRLEIRELKRLRNIDWQRKWLLLLDRISDCTKA